MNIAKEFTLENRKFELNSGIEYSFTTSIENEDAEYIVQIENGKIASSKRTAHIRFNYEHETEFGFNGKYEMMWSDKGEDSRITTGVSYRF